MSASYPVETTIWLTRGDEEHLVTVRREFTPSTPDVYYRSNGDPGEPGTNAEVDDITAELDGKEFDLTDSERDKAADALIDRGDHEGPPVEEPDYDYPTYQD